MKTIAEGQVQLSKLIFTLNWEDPASDEKALQIKNGDVVFTITSGCCNTLGFLRFNPQKIYCVDINPAQTYLMELKQAAFRNLGHDQLLGFFGIRNTGKRLEIYKALEKDISPAAKDFWQKNINIIKAGILMNGRYEKFIRLAGLVLRLMQGSRKVKKFFTLTTVQQQEAFYAQKWDGVKWKWIFRTMFNKNRLAKKGLNADYFRFDDGSTSFSESFYRRAAHTMTKIAAESNYFLSLYFTGRYLNELQLPAWLLPENFSVIKKNIDRIQPVTADSKYWLAQQPDNLFNAMSLSNICELMDENDTLKLFEEVARTGKPGSRIVFRNLIIPREVPPALQQIIVKEVELSKALMETDRSFVYGKIAAYNINK